MECPSCAECGWQRRQQRQKIIRRLSTYKRQRVSPFSGCLYVAHKRLRAFQRFLFRLIRRLHFAVAFGGLAQHKIIHHNHQRAHHRDKDGGQHVHFRVQPQADFGENHLWQSRRPWSRQERRNHHIIQRQRNAEQKARSNSRRNQRQGNHKKDFHRARAQIHRRLFQRLVQLRQARAPCTAWCAPRKW